MEKELYLLLGAGVTAAASLIGAISTGLVQRSIALVNARKEVDKESLRFQNEAKLKIISRMLERLEQAHLDLSVIIQSFSTTGTVIQQSASKSIAQYDLFYREQCGRLNEVTLLLEVYAPDLSASTLSLEGAMNNYWGHFRNWILQNDLQEKGEILAAAGHLFEFARQVNEEAWKLQTSIRQRARKLAA